MKAPTFETLSKDFVRWWTIAAWFALVVMVFAIANAAFSPMANVDAGQTLSKDAWNQMVANFDDLNARIGASSSVPSGAVMAFNLGACPTGWSEYAPAYGRFIRGIDKSGTSIDPSGQRAAWDVQTDDFKTHSHGYSGMHNEYGGWSAQVTNSYAYNWYTGWNARTTGNAWGSTETRPKNVALLYCVKN